MCLPRAVRHIAGLAILLVGSSSGQETVGAEPASAAEPLASGNDSGGDHGYGPVRRRQLHGPPDRRLRQATEEETERHLQRERNLAALKRQYFEFHGTELTDEILEAALDEGRSRRTYHLTGRLPPHLEQYREEKDPWQGRKLQEVPDNQVGMLISAESPGWPWNFGRNEFYCVSYDEISPPNLPKPNTPVVLNDCNRTPNIKITLRWTQNLLYYELADGAYWFWCIQTTGVKKNSRLRVNTCDQTNPFIYWQLYEGGRSGGDGTWRPDVDQTKCVTARMTKSGKNKKYYRKLGKNKKNNKKKKKGGGGGGGSSSKGRFTIRTCTTTQRHRMAQTFVWCQDTNNCVLDEEGFIDCDIFAECGDL